MALNHEKLGLTRRQGDYFEALLDWYYGLDEGDFGEDGFAVFNGTEISARVGMNRSDGHRALSRLQEMGYVESGEILKDGGGTRGRWLRATPPAWLVRELEPGVEPQLGLF